MFRPHIRIKPPIAHAPQRQKGLGMLMFVVVVSAIALTGYLSLSGNAAKEERLTLSQADKAVLTFATVRHRLPCPDTNRDGFEDCTGNAQKGWLPSASLKLAGADPGISQGQLRYLVQRGGLGYDLADVADDWRPLAYDDGASTFNTMRATTANGGAYQANLLTLADLCQRLEVGAATTMAAGMAQVSSSPARAVAYALVHPGTVDSDADGSLFEGSNGSNTGNAVEDPGKSPLLGSYDDRVLERSFSSLLTDLDCQPLFQSINTVALGLDVIDQVAGMRASNIDAAKRAITFASLAAAVTAVELAASAIEAASDGGNAAAEFTACVASLGIAANFCAAAPTHVASAIAAGVALGANVVSIALNVTAAVLAGNALVLADSSTPASSLSCPVIDLSGPLQSSKDEVTAAKADRDAVEAARDTKQNELNTANSAATAAKNGLFSRVRYSSGSSSTIDSRVSALYTAADDWHAKNLAHATAVESVSIAQTADNNATVLVNKYNDMLDNRATRITEAQNAIASLDGQIAAESDLLEKSKLQAARFTKLADLSLLNNVSALTAERDTAVTDRASALTALNAAQSTESNANTARSNALTTYRNAYATLLDDSYGPYTITTGATTRIACTERNPTPPITCAAGSVSTVSNVASAAWNAFGISASQTGALEPHPDSKYMVPKPIALELTALEEQLTTATTRKAAAEAQVLDLEAKINAPAACNIAGSPVTPWSPAAAANLLATVDAKGGSR
jgi:hypothetical protein